MPPYQLEPQPAPPEPHPAATISPPTVWLIRTMADDLAELKAGKEPMGKPLPLKPSAQKPTAPEAVKPTVPPPPAPKPPVPSFAPKPALPLIRPAPPVPRPTPTPPKGIVPPPTPRVKTPRSYRRYFIPAAAGVVTLGIVTLIIMASVNEPTPAPSQSPQPQEPSIEGEVLEAPPSATPTLAPSPLSAPILPDAEEVVTATPENLFSVLTAIAAKPRRAGTMINLTFPQISPSRLIPAFGIYPTATIATTTEELFAYFWTQPETPATTTAPLRTRLVLVGRGSAEALNQQRPALEESLLTHKERLWLGTIPAGEPTILPYQDNIYKGVAIRYRNFPLPDLSLDYAIISEKNLFVFAASREAMYGALDRLDTATMQK